MTTILTRRAVVSGLAATGGGWLFSPSDANAAEGTLDTTRVRFVDFGGGTCTAPQYVATELLRSDGFDDVQHVRMGLDKSTQSMMADNLVDFSLDYASALAMAVSDDAPMKALGGIHAGCYVLFAREGIDSVLDLKGKRVGVGPDLGTDPHIFISAMATYVGLDPLHDINWVISEKAPLELFLAGEIDALLAFPPDSQEIEARNIGHVVVNSLTDRPWSQYFCCLALARTGYVERYPVATKRVLRALLKASDICVEDPDGVARSLVAKGYISKERYGSTSLSLKQIPYATWRDLDPEDTIRFFSLRLHEAGILMASPQTVIERGTDWRFLTELKRELKV
jgi:NitT/TauT family transport system substrate-binding protein